MRIALALLVIAACSKSAPDDRGRADQSQPVGGAAPGNTGSAAPASEPPKETPVGSASAADIVARQPKVVVGLGSDVPPSDLPPSLDNGSGKAPPGKITIASKTSFDHTNLTADAVAESIMKDHLAALGNCYRATLARDASIKGEATLALTVKPDGTITKAKARAPDATLQTCFSQAMQTWTFPVPTSGGKATEAGFQIALALVPE